MAKKQKRKSPFGRDYVAMAEYRAGAPTPTPTKKGMLKKLEAKNKARRSREDGGPHHFRDVTKMIA